MSEINTAFGMLQLQGIDKALQQRQAIVLIFIQERSFPLSRDALYLKLKTHDVYARRYFYPLITDFPMYRGLPSAAHDTLLVARKISQQVICMPIYPGLAEEHVNCIIELIAGDRA